MYKSEKGMRHKDGKVEFAAIDGSRSVEVVGDLLTMRYMTDGGILILR
jgi:hypothetical protein